MASGNVVAFGLVVFVEGFVGAAVVVLTGGAGGLDDGVTAGLTEGFVYCACGWPWSAAEVLLLLNSR